MNIVISNLDTSLTGEDLRKLFAPYGEVESAEIAMDAFTEQSRGFGYVEMPQEDQARAAIAALHQSQVNNRQVSVLEAEAKVSYKVGDGAVNVYRFRKN
jgi:RNA recognition motif-containing protein